MLGAQSPADEIFSTVCDYKFMIRTLDSKPGYAFESQFCRSDRALRLERISVRQGVLW